MEADQRDSVDRHERNSAKIRVSGRRFCDQERIWSAAEDRAGEAGGGERVVAVESLAGQFSERQVRVDAVADL